MKSLYIVRHAKSSWEDTEIPDVVRPLNPRGKKAAVTIGKHLAKLHVKPDLIISSPATRAYHTSISIARILGYRLKSILVEAAIYYDGEQGVMNLIRHLDKDVDSVFIVGHEPTCSDLIDTLCSDRIMKFPTGSVYRIDLDIKKWSDIYSANGKKIFFITPKELT